jgi:hypothetical protein
MVMLYDGDAPIACCVDGSVKLIHEGTIETVHNGIIHKYFDCGVSIDIHSEKWYFDGSSSIESLYEAFLDKKELNVRFTDDDTSNDNYCKCSFTITDLSGVSSLNDSLNIRINGYSDSPIGITNELIEDVQP